LTGSTPELSNLTDAQFRNLQDRQRCVRHPERLITARIIPGHYDESGRATESYYEAYCYECTRANQPTVLVKYNPIAERRMEAMSTELELAKDLGQTAIVPAEVKKLLAPKASDNELILFCKIANDLGLNPFANELYLIPFGGKHTIVIAVQAYLKRASHNPKYGHYEAGLVVHRDGQGYVRTKGTMSYPGDTPYGAWCDVFKVGEIRPFTHEVKLEDWNKGTNLWAQKPEHMIMITAIRQCVRMAFPDEFGPEFETPTVEGMVVEVMDAETLQDVVEVLPPPTDASSGISAGPMVCPLHGIEFTRIDHWLKGKKQSTLCHVKEGEKGPQGGRRYCERDDAIAVDSTTGEIIETTSQASQDSQREPDGGGAVAFPTEDSGEPSP
jgi:phage recombination protein Bet